MDITLLSAMLPNEVYLELQSVFDSGINTPERLANFLGQCDEESGGFTKTVENLNYSTEALQSLFGKYFPRGDEATYARNPEMIANRIYANRMGNGDEASGDGWLHRGRGYIQLTGTGNQNAFLATVNETDLQVISDKYPLVSAAWFWNRHNLNSYANTGVGDGTVTSITKVINGDTIGLAGRIAAVNKYYAALTA